MKALIDIVLRIAELAEAEGRAAKRNAVQLIAGGLVCLGAVGLLLIGAAALLGAIYLLLSQAMPPAGALTIVAFIPLFAGLIGVLAGRALLRR